MLLLGCGLVKHYLEFGRTLLVHIENALKAINVAIRFAIHQ